ncbi:hypothetical protein DFH27DRAFT_528216 [Peziza echinospora]|nr:hypothetical protein DFH27DRAFT_528216 [Peziza echinospora]
MADSTKPSHEVPTTAKVPGSDSPITAASVTENKTQTEQTEVDNLPEPMDFTTDSDQSAVNNTSQRTGGLSPPPVSLAAQEATKPFPRSQSPAKRSASEMDGEDEAGYALSPMSVNNGDGWNASGEAEFTGSGPTHPATKLPATLPQPASSATSVLDSATGTNVSTAATSVYEGSTTEYHQNSGVPTVVDPALESAVIRSVSPPPDIEDQLTTVYLGIHQPPQEGDDYCVITGKWLKKFLSYNKDSDIQLTKEEAEGDLGPIDNTNLLDTAALALLKQQNVVVLSPPPSTKSSPSNEDSSSSEFSPLIRGTMGEDFEVLPLPTYEFLADNYGIAPGSPWFKRKASNTAPDGSASNIEVELYPPMFTLYKLRDPSAETSHATLTAGTKPPPRVIASRCVKVQVFLRRAKALLGIDLARKIRLWRLPEAPSALPISSSSRSSSPAKGATSEADKQSDKSMVIDMSTFLNLEVGAERELLENLDDHTNNQNYNGKMSMNLAGLGFGGDYVFEEQVDGQWPSEKVSKSLKSVNKSGIVAKISSVIRRGSANSSRSSSPARSQSTSTITASGSGTGSGIMSRGREKKAGRAPGTCGLQNLGNTCYMNSALQCLRNCEELSKYFLSGQFKSELNPSNPLGHGGNIARSYSNLLGYVFSSTCPSSYAPREFKTTIGRFGSSFSGYGQQDTQEFLAFLLDGLHEDLNRIHKKPYIEKPESTDEMVNDDAAISALADTCWDIYKKRNDSAVADLFGGLYKSTLVCPTCNKVSITFDPFMDLTLPLPVESLWSREILFYRKGGQPVLKVPVDMEKNGNIRGLKEYIARKFNIDPKKLLASEIYKNKFFKHYDDNKAVSSEIQPSDHATIYELDDVPTNYPAPKQRAYRSMTRPDSDDEALTNATEKLVVPVFNRLPQSNKSRNGEFFGMPFFVLLDREEQKDLDTILVKLCESYQSQTSRTILRSDDSDDEGGEASGTDTPDNDNVVVNAEDESVDGGKRVKESDGDDGYVDVEMEDVEVKEKVRKIKRTKGYSTRRMNALRSLFTIKIVTRGNNVDGLPTGWGEMAPAMDLASRLREQTPTPPPVLPARKKSYLPSERPGRAGSDESDEDYDEEPEVVAGSSHLTNDESDDENVDPAAHSFTQPAAYGPLDPSSFYGAKPPQQNKQSKTYSNQSPRSRRSPPELPPREQQPLVRYGEAIICDWTPGSYDALFGGDRDDFKGKPLWDKPELFHDEELLQKRAARASRRNKGVHLDDCLAEFAKEEILSETDPWFCPRCKEHRRASKKFELWKSPDILVIHLKRFSSSRMSRDKIDALIDFPIEGLDLTDRVGKKEEGKELIYDLFAVDNHYGGLGGGHYTAYARNYEDGKWYYFDDSSVSATNPEKSITSAAYLLFYRRRSSKPLGGPLYERILGDSQDQGEESGDGGNDPGNDSGISDNSPSSSPLRGGVGLGARRNSLDISGSSSPLVASGSRAQQVGGSSLLTSSSSLLGSSSTATTRFGGAGSSSSIFSSSLSAVDVIGTSGQAVGAAGKSAAHTLPPSYNSAELFGPLSDSSTSTTMTTLQFNGDSGTTSLLHPLPPPPTKSVNFTFGGNLGSVGGGGGGGVRRTSSFSSSTSAVDDDEAPADILVGGGGGTTSSSSSTAGDLGDASDVDADAEDDLEALLAEGVSGVSRDDGEDEEDEEVNAGVGLVARIAMPGAAARGVDVDGDGDVEMEGEEGERK